MNLISKKIILMVLGVILFTLAVSFTILYKGWVNIITGLPHIAVTCPNKVQAFLVIGQSQASNTGQARRIPQRNDNAYAFSDGSCYKLRDPIPGTAGRNGSIWPSFADQINKPVVIANIAISGSDITEWTNASSITKIKNTLFSLKKSGFLHPNIIWMQGETNGARHTSRDEYLNNLEILYKAAPDYPWIITRESICYDKQFKWQPIDDARDMFASMHNNVTIGPDLDKIDIRYRQSDKCHLTAVGQDILAMQLYKTVQKMRAVIH